MHLLYGGVPELQDLRPCQGVGRLLGVDPSFIQDLGAVDVAHASTDSLVHPQQEKTHDRTWMQSSEVRDTPEPYIRNPKPLNL